LPNPHTAKVPRVYCCECGKPRRDVKHYHFTWNGMVCPSCYLEPNTTRSFVHVLKTQIPYFGMVHQRIKRFEVRSTTDRKFEPNDWLLLVEISETTKTPTGRELLCRTGYILHGPLFGIEEGTCVMSLDIIGDYWPAEAPWPAPSTT